MKRKLKRLYSESGRSMTEMLGVLLVVGLLSTIGFASFSWVMDTMYANETKERLNKRAWEVSNSLLTNEPASIDHFKPNDGAYIIDTLVLSTNNFSLTVHDVSPEVCRKLVEANASDISNAAISSGGNCAQTGDMVFTFDNHLELHDLCSGFESTKCILSCNNETGYTFAEKGTQCGSTAQHSCDGKGHCLYNSKCSADNGEGYFAGEPDSSGNYNCFPCDLEASQRTTLAECQACSGREWRSGECFPVCSGQQWRDSDGVCHACNWDESAIASSSECGKCSSRYFESFNDNTGMGRCYLKCGNDSFRDLNGVCYPCNHGEGVASSENECNYCADRQWLNGGCYPSCGDDMRNLQTAACAGCETAEAIRTTQDDCEKCGDRYWYNGSEQEGSNKGTCFAACSGGFHETRGTCISCNEGSAYSSTELECNRCVANRTYNPDTGMCTAACSAGFMSLNGDCYACDSEETVVTASETVCDACPNRYFVAFDSNGTETAGNCWRACVKNSTEAGENEFRRVGGTCEQCQDPETGIAISQAECEGTCPGRFYKSATQECFRACLQTDEITEVRNVTGECQSCYGAERIIVASAEACDICGSSRYAVALSDGTYECISGCASGEFQTLNNGCQSCDSTSVDSDDVSVESASVCDGCGSSRYAVAQSGGTFKCFKACDTGYFGDASGGCHSCSDPGSYETIASECARCPDERTQNGNLCVLLGNECGAGQFKTLDNVCVPCSEKSMWPLESRESTWAQCNLCPRSQREYDTNYGMCIPICGQGQFRNDYVDPNTGIRSRSCTDCSNTSGKGTTAEECRACDDTAYPREMANGKCVLKTMCEEGKYKDKNGACRLCKWTDWTEYDTEGVTGYEVKDEAACKDACGDDRDTRIVDGVLKCVPAQCPWGQYQNTNGNCTGCWRVLEKATSREQCELCEAYAEQYAEHGLASKPNWEHTYTSAGKCKKTNGKAEEIVFASP